MNTTMTLTSTASPSLNGTYNVVGPIETAGLQAEVNAVALNGTFADGSASLNWPDTSRTPHTFTVAQFKEFAAAVALYHAQWAQYSYGMTQVVPSSTATIP